MPRFGEKMRHNLQWPERHGFSIGGFGPSYVLRVVKGSAADKQGLRMGDQIIELDNHRVSRMAAPALESFAKHIRNNVPVVKVVNNIQHVELLATRRYRYGLTLKYSQRDGFLIDSIQARGPAYNAGLRQDDLILAMNGESLYEKSSSLVTIQKVLSAYRGKITLAVLSCNRHQSSSSSPSRGLRPASRSHVHSRRSEDLYAKMNRLFAENYEKKMALVAVLKSYAESRNVEKLARALVLVLQTSGQRKIIPYIRLHIPSRDRAAFDEIIQRSVGKSYSEDRMAQPALNALQDYHTASHHTVAVSDGPHTGNHNAADSRTSLLYLRTVSVLKGDGDLGVVLKSRHPVVIETVLKNSAADRAGVLKGDCILNLNGISVVHSSHQEIQQLLKQAGPSVQLELIQQVHVPEHLHNHRQLTNGSCSCNCNPPITSDYDFDIHSTSPTGTTRSDNSPAQNCFGLVCARCGLSGAHLRPLPDARVGDSSHNSSTLSSQHSRSSSAGWAFQHSLRLQDRGPASFKTQVNYLLDKREKRLLKEFLYDYSNNKVIEVFVENVSALLDTPAKMTLWSHILPLLPSHHKEFTLAQVHLPDSVINGQQEEITPAAASTPVLVSAGSSSEATLDIESQAPDTMTSFKSQLEYLLTSQERKAVKRALQRYKESKDIQTLVEALDKILDTKSKRSLWIHILALLSVSHQNYARRKINLPSGYVRDGQHVSSSPQYPYQNPPHSKRNRILSQSEDEFFVVGQQHPQNIPPDVDDDEVGVSTVEMLNYTRKGSYVQRNERHNGERAGPSHRRLPGADHFMQNPLYGKHDPLSLSREADYPGNGVIADPGIYAIDAIVLPNDKTGSYRQGKPNTAYVSRNSSTGFTHAPVNGRFDSNRRARNEESYDSSTGSTHVSSNDHFDSHKQAVDGYQHKSSAITRHASSNGHYDSHGQVTDHHTDNSSSEESVDRYGSPGLHMCTHQQQSNGQCDVPDSGLDTMNGSMLQNSQGSDASYTRQVKHALQTMDDAVAGFSGGETQRSEIEPSVDIPSPVQSPLPPPPPAPPLPPAPAPPPLPDLSAPLLVKRLNWETHNPEEIDKTIWGQLRSDDQLDIESMVEYLELPQQFSTAKKKPPTAKQEKKLMKKKILNSKNAFNTSIILASLNIADVRTTEERDSYVERALLRVEVHPDDWDSGVITPHLLQQLIQYAPDKEEVTEYMAYQGDLAELSEVDRFCYKMVRIPGYLDRLKSMLFKATFDEKCAEAEKHLLVIREAAEQIRQSRSFAKVLELVLVMGNRLDKATNKPPASAFKVSSLGQLDSTKTMDKKKSFLDVLVQGVYEKYPHLLATSSELTQVPLAEKVTYHEISKEITELQQVLQRINETMSHLTAADKHYTAQDQFQEVMEHFVGSAEDKIQELERLLADTGERLLSMLTYLGEKADTADSRSLFSTISTFLTKFNNSHRLHVQRIDADLLSPRSPTSDTAQFINAL